jgi:hypothetical protein
MEVREPLNSRTNSTRIPQAPANYRIPLDGALRTLISAMRRYQLCGGSCTASRVSHHGRPHGRTNHPLHPRPAPLDD